MIGQLRAYLPSEYAVRPWLEENQRPLAAAVAVTTGTVILFRLLRSLRNRSRLRQKRENARKTLKNSIDSLAERLQQKQISEDQVDAICNMSTALLASKLQKGELKSIDVLRAYQSKAIQVNTKTNAVIAVVEEAEAAALECDQMTDRSDRPLHGLPISIKDNFPMEGYDCVLGFSRNINKPFAKDCVLVKVLKHLGAVPFVRTNVPQTLLSFDTCNPVFGQTHNPHRHGRCAGGSSGGEGALVGGGGSPLGLGGDIGGSIRIPSTLCGIYGFKPTAGRLSTRDTTAMFKGQNLIVAAYGPMARDVDSLVLMMRAVLCQYHFDLDSTIPPMPFSEENYTGKTKLRIGFYLDDDYMISVPSMHRAVNIAVAALRSQGHEVIPWKYPNLGKYAAKYWTGAIFADGGREVIAAGKDDATDHSFGNTYRLLKMSRIVSGALLQLVEWLWPRIGLAFAGVRGLGSVSEWQELVRNVLTLRQKVECDLKEKNIDIVIAPGFTLPAQPVGWHSFSSGAASYTSVVNVLNFPAGAVPVTVVNAEDTAKMADYPTPDPWHITLKKSMVGAEGLPVGVQVIGLPWQDEMTLRVMKELETALQK